MIIPECLIGEPIINFMLSDELIYSHYLGDCDFQKRCSPFRYDPGPSFILSASNTHDGRIYWRDYGLVDPIGYDAISFVQQLYGLDRYDACKRIIAEVGYTYVAPKIKKKKTVLDVQGGDLTDWELEYWAKNTICPAVLKRYNVSGCRSAAYGIRSQPKLISMPDQPVFLYEGIDWVKLYSPFATNKKDKFRSKRSGLVIEGYNQLPTSGDLLFINSSLKDTMLMSYYAPGVNPVSENNLNYLLNKWHELQQRFNRIVVFFDADRTGQANAKYLVSRTNCDSICLQHSCFKDPSDSVMATSNHFLIRQLLSDNNIKV